MKIMVLIKQVPFSSDLEVDETTGVIKRESGATKMNPYDLYALETAFRLKEETGGEVSVLTMGPPQAEQVIREAYMMGADKGFLLSDRLFAGSDVLATSRALAQGIQAAGDYSVILCGKQTTDGDTAQVASEVSEFLQIPCVTNVTAMEEADDHSLTVVSDLGIRLERTRIPAPAVIAVEKGIFQPRLPSYLRKKATRDRSIIRLSAADLSDQDPSHYGLTGSPTQVVRIFPPEDHQDQQIWQGEADEMSQRLYRFLKEEKYLEAN